MIDHIFFKECFLTGSYNINSKFPKVNRVVFTNAESPRLFPLRLL